MILQGIIDALGWTYFVAWSLSFYEQLFENFKSKNVQGMNLDHLWMNLTGFSFYSIYCSYGYFNNNSLSETGQVDLNDLIFAYHALIITMFTVIQSFIYPKGKNKINRLTIGYLILMCVFIACYSILTYGLKIINPSNRFTVMSFIGYFKLSISFLKYWPQMTWNFQGKLTKEWSTCNIILDFTGGLFSFLQMWMQNYNIKQLEINPVKLILSVMCMVYNIIFLVQYYCFLPLNKQPSKIQTNQDKFQTQRGLETDKQTVNDYIDDPFKNNQ